jgi:hypothetical protein
VAVVTAWDVDSAGLPLSLEEHLFLHRRFRLCRIRVLVSLQT